MQDPKTAKNATFGHHRTNFTAISSQLRHVSLQNVLAATVKSAKCYFLFKNNKAYLLYTSLVKAVTVCSCWRYNTNLTLTRALNLLRQISCGYTMLQFQHVLHLMLQSNANAN